MINAEQYGRTDIHTFRFGSGQVLSLAHYIIQQIPYLDGLVSFAQHSSTPFNANGYLTLDSNIDYHDLCVIIDALPFYSLTQALIRLSKHENLATVLSLMDYLGLLPAPYPTLDEIDSIFLFTLDNYRWNWDHDDPVKVDVVQDMAAHFVFILVKGDCDQASDEVIAQIRWCAMFITQAHSLFHPILRDLVYKVTRHYLHTFCPSLTHSLHPVLRRKQAEDKQVSDDILGDRRAFFTTRSFMSGKSRFSYMRSGFDDDEDIFLFRRRRFYSSNPCGAERSIVNSVSKEVFYQLETTIWSRFANDNCVQFFHFLQSGKWWSD